MSYVSKLSFSVTVSACSFFQLTAKYFLSGISVCSVTNTVIFVDEVLCNMPD